MKNVKTLLFAILILGISTTSCNLIEDIKEELGQEEFEVVGNLDCNKFQSCQDVYEFNFEEMSIITLDVTEITGNSAIAIAVYGPSVALGETNLFTENTNELLCTGQDERIEFTELQIFEGGLYKFAITRDYNESNGLAGSYKFKITSDKLFKNKNQSIDDLVSQASGVQDCAG